MNDDHFESCHQFRTNPRVLFCLFRHSISSAICRVLCCRGRERSSGSGGWILMRRVMRSQDVGQRRWLLMQQRRPTSADDDLELLPDEDNPFRFCLDENNNNNKNNTNNNTKKNNTNNSNKEDDYDDEKLKFSIDKILSDDFGQNDCRRCRHQHNNHRPLSTDGNRYSHHHHHQLPHQKQRTEPKAAVDRLDRNKTRRRKASSWTIGEETRERGTGEGIGTDEEKMKREAAAYLKTQNGVVEESRMTSAFTSSAGVFDCAPLPAWIFCTRYSDRPSSGEQKVTANAIMKKMATSTMTLMMVMM